MMLNFKIVDAFQILYNPDILMYFRLSELNATAISRKSLRKYSTEFL